MVRAKHLRRLRAAIDRQRGAVADRHIRRLERAIERVAEWREEEGQDA